MKREYDVLIIGGGIIGASCALELSRRGVGVVLIEKGGMVGQGCSYGNAGWVTPCFALPLPRPGMILKSMRWMLDPDGPLYIKPKPSLLLLRWLWRFLLSMNSRHLHASTAALTQISKYSLDEYAKLDQELTGDLGFSQKGLLMVAQTDEGLRGAIEEMELVAGHGISGQKFDEAALKNFEPSLTGKMRGAVYFPQEAHLEPLAAVRAMIGAAERAGATVLSGTEVFDINSTDGKITSLRTTRGDFAADQYVLATGAWSEAMGRALKLNIPVLGGKGYAVITKPFNPTPKVPMMLIEKKIAVTPRADTVRLAGTLELVDRDDSITVRRVDAIVRGAREFMNVPEHPELLEVWRGLRPCTPDGVPMIGRSPQYSNLILATGHQMLGLQSAPGTGRLVADIALGVTPIFDLKPFRVDRF